MTKAQERDVGKIEWRDLKREIGNMKNELNGMALVGAKPLWGSLVGRLEDLCERLSPTTSPKAIGEEPSSAEAVNTTPQSIEAGELARLLNAAADAFERDAEDGFEAGERADLWDQVVEVPLKDVRTAASLLIALDAERGRLREALLQARASFQAIQRATIEGRVCDDVAWFSDITTLHDYCASEIEIIDKSIAQMRDRFG